MKFAYRAVLTIAILLAGTNAAFAASPVGQWTITFHSEPDLTVTATQGVCFKSNRTWYSTTAAWRGGWFKKGDRFRWYGVAPSTATGTFGQFVANRLITGEFSEFERENGATINVGNWSMRYNGSACGSPVTRRAAGLDSSVTK